MNFTEFDYTKADGSKTHRVILVTSNPSKHVAGIDVTELSATDQVSFAEQMKEIHTAYIETLNKLQEQFDLKYNYRQFFPEKMENVSVEPIE